MGQEFRLLHSDQAAAGGGATRPTLFVSSLLALMRNQIAAAERMGVHAATINAPSTALTAETQPRPAPETGSTPAGTLFAAVRGVILPLLKEPMKDTEVAAALDVSNAQAKVWLQRLVDEGVVKKQKKPSGYIVKQTRLFK